MNELAQLVDDLGRRSFDARLGHRGSPETFDEALWRNLLNQDPKTWDPEATPCRWQETLWLYEALASNSSLPPIWQRWARDRITELRARDVPSERASVPVLQEGAVLAVCMDPMFEGLMRHEDGVRHTLGLRAKQVKNWPTGWNTAKNPKRLLQKAIVAARSSGGRARAAAIRSP